MGLRDSILQKIGPKIEQDKQARLEKKMAGRVITNTRAVKGTTAGTELKTVQTDFKSIRHIVEYLIVKYPEIKFGKTEPIVNKAFPGEMYDAGTFMMIKLQYIRDKKLMYYDELKAEFPQLSAVKLETKENPNVT